MSAKIELFLAVMSIMMAILLLLLDINRSIYRSPWDIWLFPRLIQPEG